MSFVLVLDTSSPAVTAAVVRCDGAAIEVLAERVTIDPRAHAELLTPHLLAALADADVRGADLTAVVVGCGPGPFTGLRVGMATAAAYGHARGIPVHGVCSLDGYLGAGVSGDARSVAERAAEALVVTDARRREVYWARYRAGVRVAGPGVAAVADVPRGDAVAVAGSAEHVGLIGLPVVGAAYPSAAALAAAARLDDPAGTPPAPLIPMYLRRPDAVEPASPAVPPGGPR